MSGSLTGQQKYWDEHIMETQKHDTKTQTNRILKRKKKYYKNATNSDI